MIRIVTILLVLFSTQLSAQIQFWTEQEILDKHWEKGRKSDKIKTAYNFITNEKWKVDDSTRYNEVINYNENGQKTFYTKYKTDWANKKRYRNFIDSIDYIEKGGFKELRRYSKKAGGHSLTYKATATYNSKGYIERLTTYGGYKATEERDYDVYIYNSKNQVIKIESYKSGSDQLKRERAFKYNEQGLLVETTATTIFGNSSFKSVSKMEYSPDGWLLKYTNINTLGEVDNETEYLWDNSGRLLGYSYTSNNGKFTKDFECTYTSATNKIPNYTHLKYPRGRGNKSFAHEFLAYKFEYFE
jgi:hypothetical protein